MAKGKPQTDVHDSQKTTVPTKPKQRTHTVAKGDNLLTISSKFLGDPSRYEEIKRLNNLPNEILFVGQVLLIS